jgi:hypothetical protein
MSKINLAEKLGTFSERWSPRTVTTYNGHDVMVVKVQGEFVWHKQMTPTISFSCSRAYLTSSCATAL